MYETILGRSEADRKALGTYGSIFLGKTYVKMGQSVALSNKVFLDIARSHVVFIAGKRGSGKSYTMGAIAEGMYDLPEEVRNRLSIILLDTMGVYWTMRYPNKKDTLLLKKWELEEKGLNVKIFTPAGFFKEYQEKGIPTDFPFSLNTAEVAPEEWLMMFDIDQNHPVGVIIEQVVSALREEKSQFSIKDIIGALKSSEGEKTVVQAAANRFSLAENWGLFSTRGTKIEDLVYPGQITVLDVSCYAAMSGGESLRALVIGLVAQKLFVKRMIARKEEEYQSVSEQVSVFHEAKPSDNDEPLVWLVVDEAHEFLPHDGKTVASKALITILREGRQPGISLVLATQQPGKIHTDVITQSDVVIAHRLTAKIDVNALGALMQSYMRQGLDKQLNILPKESGAAVVFDDANERIFPIRVRPRYTWHGGESPTAVHPKKKEEYSFSFDM